MTFITYDDNTYICQQLGVRLSVLTVSASPIVIFSFPKMVSSTNRVKVRDETESKENKIFYSEYILSSV
jgi:hypothetical protein